MPRLIYGTLLLFAITTLTGCEKYALDRQMEELCAKDGGVKVHEMVRLPPNSFDITGRVITGETQSHGEGLSTQTVGDKYVVESATYTIKQGEPFSGLISQGRLLRFTTTVRRIADDKLLGTELSYGRTGGEITLSHPSQNYCPKPRANPGVVQAVFIKGE